jgi:sugar phosphate isomerase/epimerase
MKLAYTVSTPDTKGNTLAYRGKPEEIFPVLREIGYHAVELFVRDPRDMDQDALCHELEKHGLQVAAVGTGPLFSEDKLTFTSADEKVRIEAIERTRAAINFAARFGAQVNVGKLRGDISKENPSESWSRMKQAFQNVCAYADLKNISITLEPQNRFAINNLNTTQNAINWINEQKLPNLFLMLDVFHMNIEDQSLSASIIEAKDHTIHIHFAENNRGVPGTGHIAFAEVVRVLKAIGYDRYISMEIDQLPDCRSAAKAAFEYVNYLTSVR